MRAGVVGGASDGVDEAGPAVAQARLSQEAELIVVGDAAFQGLLGGSDAVVVVGGADDAGSGPLRRVGTSL